MLRYLSAEMQKIRHTFTLHLLWIAPLVPLLCAYSGGQFSGFYFWYCAFLPGALTIMCSLIILKDSKMKYRGVLSLPVDKCKIWMGKVMACTALLMLASIIFFVLMLIWGLIPPYNTYGYVPAAELLEASSLLFIAFLWQVPLCLLLSAKFGIFITVILNMLGNIVGGAAFANATIWAFPYAIPYCVAGPILGILPNGLKPDEGSFFLISGYILPEMLISIILFVALTALTAVWFRKQEAK